MNDSDPWNPDNEDLPDERDEAEVEADAVSVDPFAAVRARAVATLGRRGVIGHDGSTPWNTANQRDRALARRVAEFYANNPSADDEHACDALSLRRWELYAGRWLAVAGGLMRRTGGKWKVTDLEEVMV